MAVTCPDVLHESCPLEHLSSSVNIYSSVYGHVRGYLNPMTGATNRQAPVIQKNLKSKNRVFKTH